ncbi:NADP oxidoreductase [Streptomyces sp. NP160]|uniref:NADPH-dependent F420 reductase n=1 Tax=Streptomyces sp. NP160 TaxID=2586637 RepID=UPI00111BC447|nr:NAD(P)-binding domain-containing protein [Streptomyces sp. NP160]TNM69672.1 NADP oxidoreductase [Streptomyces sp. NP160]
MSSTSNTGTSSSSSTIGIIGAGHIGSAVAQLAVDAGLDVVIANSRGPETLTDLVSALGPHARAATADEAARAGDVVVLTVPLKSTTDIDPEPLAGTVVLDTGNYYPQRDGQVAALDDGSTTSSALTQQHLADSSVVKVFNNIYSESLRSLARPSGDAERTALPVFADDEEAKAVATAFLDVIGYDAVDGGDLAESWRAEPGRPAYGLPYAAGEDFTAAKPAGADAVREALARAER